MPRVDVVVETEVSRSARARQLEGMFDVPPQEKQRLEWSGDVPLDEKDWNIGLIVGPSGSGKTTLARQLFAENFDIPLEWNGASVIDDFDKSQSISDVSQACQAVGFNTIPAWLRPYHVLSNGEKFRVDLARRLLELESPIVVDEFTSVVDRQVAQIGSYAVAKAVRRRGLKFVAVTCHFDVIEWLQPDWVLEPAGMAFHWREVQRRPSINVAIQKVPYDFWTLFAPFHYMSAKLHRNAQCYCLFVDEKPAALGAMLYRPHSRVHNVWGLSRVVTLPDYQGLGLAFVLMDHLAEAFTALGQRFHTYPAHPALIRSFDKSDKWRLVKKPGYSSKSGVVKTSTVPGLGGRPNATFEFIGEPMARDIAAALIDIPKLSAA